MSFVRSKSQRGQAMVEYIIILALIAVAAIGVYSLFGKTVRNQSAVLSKELAGAASTTQVSNAKTAATDAGSNANTGHDMGNYTNGNQGH